MLTTFESGGVESTGVGSGGVPEANLAALTRRVRAELVAAIPDRWTTLAPLLRGLVSDPLPAVSALPLAAAWAAGSDPTTAVPVAAAWHLIGMAARVLDDLADDDHRDALHLRIGAGRAATAAAGLLELAQGQLHRIVDPAARDAIVADHHAVALEVWAAQDRDVAAPPTTAAAYHELVFGKTSVGFGFALAAGARVARADRGVVEAARGAGHHLGAMLQMLDDLESCFVTLPGDLEHGRRTYPLWLGLAHAGPLGARLRALVDAGIAARAAEIRATLESLDVRAAVLAAALAQRDRVCYALDAMPDPRGVAALRGFLDWSLRDGARLLGAR